MGKRSTISDMPDLLNRVDVRVDDATYDALQAASSTTGFSVSDIIRWLIKNFLREFLKRIGG